MAKVLRLLVIVIVLAGAAGAIYAWVGSRDKDSNGNTLLFPARKFIRFMVYALFQTQ